jgi:hypothetical protein
MFSLFVVPGDAMPTPTEGQWVRVALADGQERYDWVPLLQPNSPDGYPGVWHVVGPAAGDSGQWQWFPAIVPTMPMTLPANPAWHSAESAEQVWSGPPQIPRQLSASPAHNLVAHPLTPLVAKPGPGGSSLAITSLALGIIALLLAFVPIINNFAFVLAVVGFPIGVIAWRGAIKRRRSGKGMAAAGTVLAALSMVGVLASQAVYSKAFDDFGKDLDKFAGNATGEVLAGELDVRLGRFEIEVGEYGLTTTRLPVTLTNKSAARRSFDILVQAVGPNGERISDDRAYVSDLDGGQSTEQNLFALVSDDDTAKLRSATFTVVTASSY